MPAPGEVDANKHIVTSLCLIPPFNEKDIDIFFLLFKRVADAQVEF